jgi:hypothetical protein
MVRTPALSTRCRRWPAAPSPGASPAQSTGTVSRSASSHALPPIRVPEAGRVLYHAAATMSANLGMALADMAAEAWAASGAPPERALRALVPLLHGAVENLAAKGPPGRRSPGRPRAAMRRWSHSSSVRSWPMPRRSADRSRAAWWTWRSAAASTLAGLTTCARCSSTGLPLALVVHGVALGVCASDLVADKVAPPASGWARAALILGKAMTPPTTARRPRATAAVKAGRQRSCSMRDQ